MRVPTGPLVAVDLVVLGIVALLPSDGGQVLYGFLSLIGGLVGTAVLYVAVGRWAIRRLEVLEARTEERHAENQVVQQKMWAFLLGVEGVGGLREEQKRNQRRRHDLAQDMSIVLIALGEHTTQIARLSDKAGLDFDPPELDRPRRRVEDDER